MSKIVFLETTVLINGVRVDDYYLDEGERVDGVFIYDGVIESAPIFFYNGVLTCDKLYFSFFDGVYYAKLKKCRNEERYVVWQTQKNEGDITYKCTCFFDNLYAVVLDDGENCIIKRVGQKPELIELNVIESVVYALLRVGDEAVLLCVNANDFSELKYIAASRIKIDGVGVSIETERGDMAKTKATEQYVFSRGDLSKVSEKNVCARAQVLTARLIPVEFLQSILCKNAQASDFLTDGLKPDLKRLKIFLGEFVDFYAIEEGIFALVYGDDKTRIFKFESAQNLISNVIEYD